MIPDLINGLFEFAGAFALALNVRQLWRDKEVKGVHPIPTAFFAAWGLWNLFYYPHLGQYWSLAGGDCSRYCEPCLVCSYDIL